MGLNVREHFRDHRYEAVEDSGRVAGVIEYVDHRDVRVLFHTEVCGGLEGQGVGSTRARAVLDALAHLATRVICPYLVGWIEQHPDYPEKVTLR
ncbi:hypothetical protein BH18ACT9_BH18ACT9_22490 [soil metagenome]